MLLLDQLGTDKNIMFNMQIEALQNITRAFLCGTEAGHLMRNFSPLLNAVIPLQALIKSNVNILNETFFRRALDVLVKRAVVDLRDKARIPVSMDKGRISE